jgi:hypothetical protein
VIACVERPEDERLAAHPRDAREYVVDHAVEPQAAPIVRGVYLLDAVLFQRGDLVRRNGATAADDHANVIGALLAQHVDHVGEVFVVASLIGGDCNRIGIFLNRRAHDVRHAAIVTKMNDFGSVGLQQATNHVDGRIVAVKQRRRAHKA